MDMQRGGKSASRLLSSGCSASETGSGAGYNEGKQDFKLIASPKVNAPADSTTKPIICSGMNASHPNMRDSIPGRRFRQRARRHERAAVRTNENGAQRVGDDAVAGRQHFCNLDAKEIEKPYRDPERGAVNASGAGARAGWGGGLRGEHVGEDGKQDDGVVCHHVQRLQAVFEARIWRYNS